MWVGFKKRRGWEVNPENDRDRKEQPLAEKPLVEGAADAQTKRVERDFRPPRDRRRDLRA